MEIKIKQLSGSLSEQEKQYLRKKFLWLKKNLDNPATLTIGVRERITKKSNQAYEIILHLIKPGVKNPIYIRTFGNDFRTAVDVAKDKMERVVIKRKEKGLLHLRIPKLSLKRDKK